MATNESIIFKEIECYKKIVLCDNNQLVSVFMGSLESCQHLSQPLKLKMLFKKLENSKSPGMDEFTQEMMKIYDIGVRIAQW